jgi:hypothetical protein
MKPLFDWIKRLLSKTESADKTGSSPGTSQQNARAALEKIGARLQVDREGHVTAVRLSGTKVTDVELANVRHFHRLQMLRLRRTKVTDEGLVHLRDLRQLISLDLDETWISDAGLEHLKAIPSLEVVDLSETEATPQGIEALRDSLPGCVITYR